jgi:hypothetical protein
MNFNDIKARIERMHIALNSRFDDDYKKHAKVTFEGQAVTVSLPAKDTKEEIIYKIISILHNLATLKDHLKGAISENGFPKEKVEHMINHSVHLQVLIDLVNMDKHSDPLRSYRFGRKTEIRNVGQGLINNNDGKPIVMTIGTAGELETVHGKPPSVKLVAEIYDETGNYLFDLDTLIEVSYTLWMHLAKTYDCI